MIFADQATVWMTLGIWADAVWPYLLMSGTAFLAATILPFSSEVAFVAQLKAGLGSTAWLLCAATVGNVGGSLFNWWIGRELHRFEGRKWFPFKSGDIDKASDRFKSYGTWALLLSWVPVVGDPLTLVAGILRVPLAVFLTLVTIGKLARYAVIAWVAN